jgi:hypothetical protein
MNRQINYHIDQIEARLAAAEAPYKAEEREIEQAIDALKARLRAVYEARCEVAKPFEIELDRFYDQQNEEAAYG